MSEERDTRPVTIERSDAIDAAAGLLLMARDSRKQAGNRRNAGPENAQYRKWLRDCAAGYEAAAKRVQAVADEAF